MYTLNDFFCGCGGLGLGFQNAGFKIVGAWDFDKYAVATYRENVGDHVVQADIQKMCIEDVPKADVWAFGFPCQDLSVAGKQAGIKLECADCGTVWEVSAETYSEENLCPGCGGTNHRAATRSGMFFEIMRLLAEAREREREREPEKDLHRGSPDTTEQSARGKGGREYHEKRYGKDAPLFPIVEATKAGIAVGRYGDAINIAYPESNTRRGRVGKEIAQSLLTGCSQVVICDKKGGENDT